MTVGVFYIAFDRASLTSIQHIFQTTIAFMAFVIMVGNYSQVQELRSGRGTGAVSLALHSVYLFKNISLVAFGFVLGTDEGWPFIFFGAADASMKIIILYYYFKAQKADAPQKSFEPQEFEPQEFDSQEFDQGKSSGVFQPQAKVVGS